MTIRRFVQVGLATAFALAACLNTTDPLPNLAPGGHHVLFIGNSLTYVNDLPGTLSEIAALTDDTIRTATVAEPDFALIDHFTGRSNALAAIQQGGWEYVVLQQGSSSLPINRDTLILATKLFNPYIRSVGARPALYMVWPTSDRISFFDDVRISYQEAATAVGGVFMPCGIAWTKAWAEDSTLTLYAADGLHPSPIGTYLAALVMYERITGKDATSLPARALVAGKLLNLSDATVRLLQRAAHAANQDFPP